MAAFPLHFPPLLSIPLKVDEARRLDDSQREELVQARSEIRRLKSLLEEDGGRGFCGAGGEGAGEGALDLATVKAQMRIITQARACFLPIVCGYALCVIRLRVCFSSPMKRR